MYEPPQWPEGERPQESEASNLPESEAPEAQPGVTQEGEYEQSYDLRGHPENSASRSAARRLRKAQNDILATIGVCVSVDKDGKLVPSSSIDSGKEQREMQRLASIISENEFGFWLSAGQAAALLLASSFPTCIRQRLEVRYQKSPPSLLLMTCTRLSQSGLILHFWMPYASNCGILVHGRPSSPGFPRPYYSIYSTLPASSPLWSFRTG